MQLRSLSWEKWMIKHGKLSNEKSWGKNELGKWKFGKRLLETTLWD